jgi:ribosomal protein S18 acetylase RimI-like enzyme
MSAPVELIAYRPEYRNRMVDLWRASFAQGVGVPVPNPVEAHRRYVDEHTLVEATVHLALQDGQLAGFGAFTPASVVQLYVHVDHHGRGIGTRLLDRAKADSGGRLWLYTFATNANARRFYERHGFDIVERGFEPVMQLPDLRYEWRRKTLAPQPSGGGSPDEP